MDVPNKDERFSGSFGEVHFAIGSNVDKVTIPVNAMLFRAEGPRLAVVGDDKKIQLRPISIGRDYGASLEILGGIAPGDQVVINPPDSLEEGQEVNIASAQKGPSQNEESPQQQQQQPKSPQEQENAPLQKQEQPGGQKGSGR